MAKIAVWPFVINTITVTRKKTTNGRGEEKEVETWVFKVSPGNENFGGETKVLIMFKGTHAWPSQKRFQDLLTGKTFVDGKLEITDVPDNLKTLGSDAAWDKNRGFGCTALAFASIPFNEQNPTQEFCVWDAENNQPMLDKNGKKILRTQETVCTVGTWVPDPETGEGTWVSAFGGSLEDGLRSELSTQISRNRYKPIGAPVVVQQPATETPPAQDIA